MALSFKIRDSRFEIRDLSFDIRDSIFEFHGKCLIKRSQRQAMVFVILVEKQNYESIQQLKTYF